MDWTKSIEVEYETGEAEQITEEQVEALEDKLNDEANQ